jgi:hypothetical protein
MLTVEFSDGKEKQHGADGAGPDGPLFVLRKYNPKRRKSEACQTFAVDTVVSARTGRMTSARRPASVWPPPGL